MYRSNPWGVLHHPNPITVTHHRRSAKPNPKQIESMGVCGAVRGVDETVLRWWWRLSETGEGDEDVWVVRSDE
ncbi:hypothetical protein QVD17_36265 [Tagetes erecta]|uniref:Uncharacterized protein n=1 Tax=Tagetes erecta TaxID=13708 RepID=A0AAD8JW08_TARER|nr:hypothetical protein QVD17_36265 [Tagetes erecta]